MTVKGQELLATVLRLSEAFEGQWGELSAVGEQEQKGIAERMLLHYPEIFVDSARIEAIASIFLVVLVVWMLFFLVWKNRIPHW